MSVAVSYQLTLPSGVQVTYWRATSIVVNLESGTAEVTVLAWVNEDSYSNSMSPVTSRTIPVTLSQSTMGNISAALASLIPTALAGE